MLKLEYFGAHKIYSSVLYNLYTTNISNDIEIMCQITNNYGHPTVDEPGSTKTKVLIFLSSENEENKPFMLELKNKMLSMMNKTDDTEFVFNKNHNIHQLKVCEFSDDDWRIVKWDDIMNDEDGATKETSEMCPKVVEWFETVSKIN